jgi:hypothetical protein
MGTSLVTCPADQQAAFVNNLRKRIQPNLSFSDVLKLAVLDNALSPTFLTRIRKDLDHGEFNLSFSDLLDLPPADALEAFEKRLTYYSRLYARSRIKLTNILAKMTQILKDDVASQVIYRIVTFHEQLYSNTYTKADGEYAV